MLYIYSEKELEEKIEDAGNFLEKVILLETDIEKIKTNETNIRNNILSGFHNVCTELKVVDNCCNVNKSKYRKEGQYWLLVRMHTYRVQLITYLFIIFS